MPDCQLLKGCLFFCDKMPDTRGLGSIYKTKYCLNDNSRCARYMVATRMGREKVPANLYPNMYDRAQGIIGGTDS